MSAIRQQTRQRGGVSNQRGGAVSGIGQMVSQARSAQDNFKSPFARQTPPALPPQAASGFANAIKNRGFGTPLGGGIAGGNQPTVATPAVEPTIRDSIPITGALQNAVSETQERFQSDVAPLPVADPAQDGMRRRQFSDNANFARGRFNR